MPILKVSEAIQPKQGYSGMRIPVVSDPVDICPQCRSTGYRDGMCVNAACNYLDPRLERAYQEYAMATMVQQQAKADAANSVADPDQKNNTKKKATADGQTPFAIIDQFSPDSEKVIKEKCKRCGGMSIVDGTCETHGCFGSLPPKPFRTPQAPATGINYKEFGVEGPDDVVMHIPKTFPVLNSNKIKPKSKSRRKAEKTIDRIAAAQDNAQQQIPVSPGMFLDSQMILPKQPVVLMQEALQLDATMKSEAPFNSATDGNNTDKKTSEEL